MSDLLQGLLAWVSAHPAWAHLAVFLVALTESLAIVGLVVPGVIMMLGAGALIAAGALEFMPVCLWAVAGAVSGDGLSYWLGRHFQERLRALWPFTRYPESLEGGIRFFQRYGGKSVVFGRFVGPVRAVVPLVAGMLGMPPARFLVANVISAFAWAPAYLLPGIVFGASLELAAEAAARLVLVLVALVGSVWLVAWGVRELFLFFSPRANRWMEGLLGWADVHPKFREMARALADPEHPNARALTTLAALLILTTALFGLVTGLTVAGAPDLTVNQATRDLGLSLHTPTADYLMGGMLRLGDAWVILSIFIAAFAYLRWQGRRRQSRYWAAAAAFALLAGPILHLLLYVPLPETAASGAAGASFPSDRALRATVLYGFFAVSVAGVFPSIWRWLPYAAAAVLTAAVGLAELYFGNHWLTDVAGSLTLGLAWVAALGLAFRSHTRREGVSRGLGLVVLATLGLAFALQSVSANRPASAPPRALDPLVTIAPQEWREHLWQTLPQRREDLWHKNNHPLDLQYAGALDGLKKALAGRGWSGAEMLSAHDLMKLLSPSLPLQALPVVPQVHDGHHEALTLVKRLPDGGRLVLRLWATRYRLEPPDLPLWVGNVTAQHKQDVLNWFVIPTTSPELKAPLAELVQDLQGLGPQEPNGRGTAPVLVELPQ